MACSDASAVAHEPLAGTAPQATAWLVIEQPTSWGSDALDCLPDDLGAYLTQASAGSGVRIVLARRPTAPRQRAITDPVRVWLAHTPAGDARLLAGTVTSLDVLRDWSFPDIGRGSLPAFGAPIAGDLHLMCTNGRRDACCARLARPVLNELNEHNELNERESILECSHLGGHRFAPTMLSLPGGYVHGRVSAAGAASVIAASRHGQVSMLGLRGRTSLPAPLQVADLVVREHVGNCGRDDLDVLIERDGIAVPPGPSSEPVGAEIRAQVRHRDGRAWSVTVIHRVRGEHRPMSCGASAEALGTWEAAQVVAIPGWQHDARPGPTQA